MLWFLGLIVFMIGFYIYKNKIHIDFASFFKKGFKPLDSRFGVYSFCGKQGTGKTYSAIEFSETLLKGQCDVFICNIKSYYDNLRKIKERGRFRGGRGYIST